MASTSKSLFRRFRRPIFILVLLPVFYVLFVMVFGTFYDYEPPRFEQVPVQGTGEETITDTFELINWNIGYAGLGAEMDFFYDGGKQVRPSEELADKYLNGIRSFLAEWDSVEFFLLQEVDSASARSYLEDEVSELTMVLPGYAYGFGKNYDVPFVPKPWLSPLGKVKSGLLTLSRFRPDSISRYAFEGNYGWPTKVFMLDRCFLVYRKKLNSGKELVVINTHNSGYDGGELKSAQVKRLRDFSLEEYKKGNFVIIGGDWNQCPPYFAPNTLSRRIEPKWVPTNIPADIFPAEWQWMYDAVIPTQRDLATPFDPKTTFQTVLDFYLCSPNVQVLRVKTIYQGFELSDHHPVYLKVKLKS